MVKPARTPRLSPPSRPSHGTIQPHRAQHGTIRPQRARLSKVRLSTRIKQLAQGRAKQPVAGSAKAGGQSGGSQNQGQAKDTEMDAQAGLQEFMGTGRTGRRNALPDISDENAANLTTGDLPLDMAKLSCAEGGTTSSQAGQSSPQGSKPPS